MSQYHHGNLKSELISASLETLTENKEPSLRALAKQAGVLPAAVYRHFKNKDELFTEIAIEGFRLLEEKFDAIEELPPKEKFIQLGLSYVEFALEHTIHFKIMSGVFNAHTDNRPNLNETCEKAFNELIFTCTALSKTPEDIHILAAAAWSQVHGYAHLTINGELELFGDSPPTIEHILALTWDGLDG